MKKQNFELTYCHDEALDTMLDIGDRKVPVSQLDGRDISELRTAMNLHPAILRVHNDWVREGYIVRANKIRDSGTIEFANYGDVDVPLPVNWSLGSPGNDNLTWQLHSMFFLKDLVRAHTDSGENWYLERASDFVAEWAQANITENPPSSFSWNDHSTAFRLLALTQVLLHCVIGRFGETSFLRLLTLLIVRHQRILASDEFYSKGTNHGLDQAHVLYFSSQVLCSSSRFPELNKVSSERLSYELVRSFSTDGVHTENSPEYHDLIFTTAIKINSFVKSLSGEDLISDLSTFARQGLRFLTFILRPDGCWPPIGDSTVRPPRSSYLQLSNCDGYLEFQYSMTKGTAGLPSSDWHAVFPASGYMVMRSDPALVTPSQRLHLVFKCSHLNYYHRQDDDNSFTLWAFGEEWLVDGGLYKHDHQDPQREYLRSAKSHNVLIPVGARVERRHCPDPVPQISGYSAEPSGATWVEGISGMFAGFLYLRRIDYDGRFDFIIRDEIRSMTNHATPCHQYWQFPTDKNITISNNKASITSTKSGMKMQMEWEYSEDLWISRLDGTPEGKYCQRSTMYGKLEPVQVIVVRCSKQLPISLSLRIHFSM